MSLSKNQELKKENVKARRPALALALSAAFLLGVAWAPAQAARTKLDKAALVVNQEVVTENEIEEGVGAYFIAQGLELPPSGSPQYRKAREEILETITTELLVAQEADAIGIVVPEEEVDRRVNLQIEDIRKGFPSKKGFQAALAAEGIDEDDLRAENKRKLLRQMKAQQVMQYKREASKGDDSASKEEVKARYEKNPSDYDRARFAIILFRVPENAQKGYVEELKKQAAELKTKIETGGDFAAMAKKYSEDPMSAEQGGDMGEMIRLDLAAMDRAMSRAVFSQPLKKISVVRASNSVCLVKVISRTKATFADAAPLIRRALQSKQQTGVLEGWLKDLKARAYIKKY